MQDRRLIDLSHDIESGMITYQGLPAPIICDFWEREASRAFYEDGSTFQIGRIDMVANTGTYLDSPFHRFADGCDLAGLALERITNVPGIVLRHRMANGLGVEVDLPEDMNLASHAILFNTGWDKHWRTDQYSQSHPFLTERMAQILVERRVAIVGIDSYNIDDTRTRCRPVHTILLRAGIPICEHMTRLDLLPDHAFRFFAVPPKIKGMGTFPVRAHAVIGNS